MLLFDIETFVALIFLVFFLYILVEFAIGVSSMWQHPLARYQSKRHRKRLIAQRGVQIEAQDDGSYRVVE